MTTIPTAADLYAASEAEAIALLDAIRAGIEANRAVLADRASYGRPTNYCDAGTMAHLASLLRAAQPCACPAVRA